MCLFLSLLLFFPFELCFAAGHSCELGLEICIPGDADAVGRDTHFEWHCPRHVLSHRNTMQAKFIILKCLVAILKVKETGELTLRIYFI